MALMPINSGQECFEVMAAVNQMVVFLQTSRVMIAVMTLASTMDYLYFIIR